MDSPGDNEILKYLEDFSTKGYKYSKMFVYLIKEDSKLDADSLTKNENLERIIDWRIKYKIPVLILLTHFDAYCYKVKNQEKDWKNICKTHINSNKTNLINCMNDIIRKKYNSNYKINDNDVIHTIFIEPNQANMQEQSIPENLQDMYNQSDEEGKKKILKIIQETRKSAAYEYINSTKKELKDIIFDRKKLCEQLKKYLPSQYHRAVNA